MAVLGTKGTISGAKIVPESAVVTPFMLLVINFLDDFETVTRIHVDSIRPLQGRRMKERMVKIHDQGTLVLVTATDRTSVQKIRFYSRSIPRDVETLARWTRNEGIKLRFEKALRNK